MVSTEDSPFLSRFFQKFQPRPTDNLQTVVSNLCAGWTEALSSMDSYRCIRHPINLYAHPPQRGSHLSSAEGGLTAGTIFLIAGPSGSGKTTLTQELVRRVPGLTKAVTVTTRQPRPGEISGVDYHFVSTEHFREMQQSGELIESDFAYNEHYGVPRTTLDMAGDIAIIITVDGALTLRRQVANTLGLFILPTCPEAASVRVAARKCPNEEFRIAGYEAEVLAARHFDYVILNLDFKQSLCQMEKIVLARRQPLVLERG